MGFGFDNWIYWHLFTITVDYDNSHIELLLNDVCLTNAVSRISHCCLNLGPVSRYSEAEAAAYCRQSTGTVIPGIEPHWHP
jgi:hypothetical protein